MHPSLHLLLSPPSPCPAEYSEAPPPTAGVGVRRGGGGGCSSPPPALFPEALVGGEGGRLDQLQYDVRKGSVVNVNPTNTRAHSETPEIRKYKKRFNSEILCAALWGEPGPGAGVRGRSGVWRACAPGQAGWAAGTGPGDLAASCRRRQLAGGHRERPDAAGPKRAGQSVRAHRAAALPADGRAGRAQPAYHHLRSGGRGGPGGGGAEEGGGGRRRALDLQ